ncbi:hypothetical protein [Vibrio zhanjiangensis]|nr:hypothetical protein [Vibrio zhanjiangensis]
MAIYNAKSMADIVDRRGKPFALPSALTQLRKTWEADLKLWLPSAV